VTRRLVIDLASPRAAWRITPAGVAAIRAGVGSGWDVVEVQAPAAESQAQTPPPPAAETSPAQSSGNNPARTSRWNDECGQSRTRLTRPCLTGLM